MRILFWVGYRFEEWNSQSDGLGGTEIAVSKVAESLAQHGHEVTVAGEVISDVHNRVTWLSIQDFENSDFKGLDPNRFDIVIGVNYLHFMQVLDENGLKPKLTAFWLHNTEWHQYYKGEVLENQMAMLNRIDHVITPSSWANNKFIETYCQGSLLDGPVWDRPVHSQVNGIDPLKFKMKCAKDPNKFIWSSAVDRGLDKLLDNWWRVKEIMPEATLDVYYPKYSDPHVQDDRNWYNIDGILDKLENVKDLGVNDMGSVSQDELHLAMQKASYWMYLTDYEETFCITALEMQMAGVFCIVSDTAALPFVVKDGIIVPTTNDETMFKNSIQLLDMMDQGLKRKALRDAKERAKTFNWDLVGQSWHDMLKTYLLHTTK
tara:strand:+ start:6866 stop:7990 length:1125 start_codon:yes stop_codon:yes gene_type:complete